MRHLGPDPRPLGWWTLNDSYITAGGTGIQPYRFWAQLEFTGHQVSNSFMVQTGKCRWWLGVAELAAILAGQRPAKPVLVDGKLYLEGYWRFTRVNFGYANLESYDDGS
jgi:hypothetical protein